MPGKIQMKRGTYAAMDLNALYQGEWYYCTDTKQTFMAHGDGTGVEMASNSDVTVLEAEHDGWIAAGETWTYASASTFTVTGDVTGKCQKGDKVKLTQTTAKYFYVLSASYSAPSTTVTVIAGTSYTVADAAITSPYYSHEANPIGFPSFFTYTPVASATVGAFTTTTCSGKFSINGGVITAHNSIQINSIGTASGNLLVTLPLTPSGSGAVFGRESAATGVALCGYVSTNVSVVFRYDNSFAGQNGHTCDFCTTAFV